MKIYNICNNLSISVVKHVQLQKMIGAETIVCYNKCGIPRFASERCGVLFKPPNVQTVTHFCDWADIVMVHTSTMSTGLLEIETDKPIIWACHDYVPGEHDKFKDKIKACIVPSEAYKGWVSGDFPKTVIHRKVAIMDWPKWKQNRINCTIMMGVVGNDPRAPYRHYEKALELLDGRMIVQSAIMPSQMSEAYPIMETVGPSKMLERMAMFDTSWCGCGTDSIQFDTIVNNKLHESIASGAVPILYRSREMSDYVRKYQCGVTWSGEYPCQDELYNIRRSIQQNKGFHSLEAERPKLQALISAL
jgi:hypothetical protein